MARYSITIPDFHPATVNELTASVKQRIRLKKRDRDFITTYVRLKGGVPLAAGRRRVGLTIHLTPGQRRCDVDGYWKSLLDALSFNDLIVNDSPVWLEITPVEFDPERRDRMATTVTIEDL